MRPPPPEVLEASRRLLRRGERYGVVRTAALGLLLLQLGWILAVPPFRGADEFDHAYRAAAVARGEWVADPSDATRGTGAFVTVPLDIVEAAQAECRRFPYTKSVDCEPRGTGPMVTIASGAGRYNPLFYALTGTPARAFDGTTAFYVMRITGATLCWLLVISALWAASRYGDTGWATMGVALAVTPVLAFSTTVMAPNGLEMASALAYWSSMLALLRREWSQTPPLRLVALATVSGVLLVTLRSLGPLWCVLSTAALLLATRPGTARLKRLLTRPSIVAAVVVMAVATVGGIAWTMSMGSLTIGAENVKEHSRLYAYLVVLEQMPLWVLQSLGAFPTRSDSAPTLLYVAELALLVVVAVLARRQGVRAFTTSALVVGVVALLIPAMVTIRTFDRYGTAWQGRYTVPFAMGLVLLLCAGLDQARRQLRADVAAFGLVAYVAAHVIGATALLARERNDSPGATNGAWWLLPTPVVGVLLATGAVLLWCAAASRLPGVARTAPHQPAVPPPLPGVPA